jgi:RNA polymerase sigma-70 factor (ECF subfamily)
MNHQEDPLEQLLDEQSDSEFGLPQFKEQRQVLAQWTAQDFSDIYVRFYPHLLRHAKRFLTNHAQAEEVVQDAFLYLMTSLPDIDSEIGVLKLLKWKVRNLALDVISSNGKASFAPADELDLPVEHELSENLVRADEAAIVSLALAKLPPRQREALIASLYEEKDTPVIAGQLGLSENATRQLLFRAKATFRKALVGEAETAGLSVSQILSIAARKAAQDSGKYITAASAFLLVLAVSIGFLPNLPRGEQSGISAPSVESNDSAQLQTPEEDVTPSGAAAAESFSAAPAVYQVQASQDKPNLNSSLVGSELSLGATEAGFAYGFGADREQLVRELLIFTDSILSATVDIVRVGDTYSYELRNARATLTLDGELLEITAGQAGSSRSMSEDGQVLTLVSTGLRVLDSKGNEYAQQPLAESSLTVLVELDLFGQVIAASVYLN